MTTHGAPLHAQVAEGTAEAEILGELRLRTDRTSDVTIVVPAGLALPEKLRERLDSGDGVRSETDLGIELRWTGLPVPAGLTRLVEGQEGSSVPLSARIVMARGAAFDDMWDVQYTLTQGGIRKVRFVSGQP